jgi:lipoyl(octanoyl) transferase
VAGLHTREAHWLDLGVVGFDAAHRLQREAAASRRQGEAPDLIMVATHEPCLTLGSTSKPGNIRAGAEELAAAGIAVHRVERGGDVTYHGPGQLVCYPIIDLQGYGKDVHAHARRLEEVMIRTAAAFGVPAHRDPVYPGVWCASGKLGAIGFGVRRWVTMHGASLNVSPHMAHFDLIVPCGITGRPVTSLELAGGREIDMDEARSELRRSFEAVLGARLIETSIEELVGSADERGVAACR